MWPCTPHGIFRTTRVTNDALAHPIEPTSDLPTLRDLRYHVRSNYRREQHSDYLPPVHHTTMSDDTRETVDVNALPPKPRAPANIMPGGTAHTAGGEKTSDGGPSYIDAVRTLGPEYYMNFHKRPCVRDSQLQGLAAGFAGGSLAAIIGSTSLSHTSVLGVRLDHD
jgi:hypothetical protein